MKDEHTSPRPAAESRADAVPALVAMDVPPRTRPSNYPEPYASRMAGRVKRALGDPFGLTRFGVNLTTLCPGAVSALRHAHTRQDEWIYIISGEPALCTDEGKTRLRAGMCAGFKAGTGNAHRLINDTDEDVVYLEVGDRTPGDEAVYPDDDIMARLVNGKWTFFHKDGTPY
ncbi:MAG TPA: cupin domain-containing protein [Noviherbaspirillum sp.]|uniref:cupin domain-containing protein n=1 Tax=Noviherbaspirillum sp. TaxID=1926288 RepID=UPI002DDD7446|nr:cupin domain-containing protein [Noviherbaspirillum sp.]HEV2612606.1 cupin domain-containing protein [Noviherbaspirillum sp.]